MVSVTLNGARELVVRLGEVTPAIRRAAVRRMNGISQHLATYAREHFEESGLHVRTGDLRRSESALPTTEDERGVSGGMVASQSLPYGPPQEFGATIFPTHGQYLTIPLDEALTDAGVARFTAREAEDAGYKTFIRGKIIYGVKDGILYPLFLLVSFVVIPPRPFVTPVLKENQEYVERELKAAVDEGLKESDK